MPFLPGSNFGDKFANFNIFQATYKEARGDSLYADWFPSWLLELAQAHGAIIASANYRFLPEATGLQILEDVDDFWSWLHSDNLKDLLASQSTPIELNLDRIIAAGDSAGGLLSVYLTLSYPDQLRAGTATYPVLAYDEPVIYPPKRSALMPEVPESVIDEYLATLQPRQYESSDLDLKRVALSSAISQHRRALGFYVRDSKTSPHRDRLFQLTRLDHPDAKLPPGGLVIIHGSDDDNVLPEVSKRFVDKARVALQGRQGGDKVVLCLQLGGHGFHVNASLQEKWYRLAADANSRYDIRL